MKKSFRIIALFAVLVMTLSMFAGCTNDKDNTASTADITSKVVEKVNVNLATLKGPTGIGMTWLLDSADKGEALNNYTYTIAAAPDEITGKLVNGSIDIAALPTNAAANLYQKTEGKVKLLSLNTLGVLYILENGEKVNSVSDLKGMTIGASGQGAVPEFALNYILTENGIDLEKDVEIKWFDEHSELATQMLTGKVNVAIVPEPFVTTITMQDENIRVALNVTEEWENVADCILSMGCIVVRTEFAEKNPKAVENFLNEYQISVDKTNNNIDETADLCVNYEIVAKKPIAIAAIPRCNIVNITGDDMKDQIKGFYDLLFNFKAGLIGGALPDENFYYEVG